MNLYSQQNLWLLLILIPAVLLLTRLKTRRLRRFTRFAEPQFRPVSAAPIALYLTSNWCWLYWGWSF